MRFVLERSGSRILPNRLIIGDRPPPCSLEVIILTVLEGPEKSDQAYQTEHQRQRNENDQDFHQASSLLPLRARSAFNNTSRDEPDIAAAATSGVARPAIAKGTASRLYPAASHRFCRI